MKNNNTTTHAPIIERATNLYKRYFVQATLLVIVPMFLIDISLLAHSWIVNVFIVIPLILISVYAYAGFVSHLVSVVRNKKTPIRDHLRHGSHRILAFLGLTIALTLLITLGFIALIVPGLLLLHRYMMSPYFMFDRGVGINESMKLSAEFAKSHSGTVWNLVGISIAYILVSAAVGMVFEGLGIIIPLLISTITNYASVHLSYIVAIKYADFTPTQSSAA